MLGGWFLVEAVVLSGSKGIVHPYYVSALAPGDRRDGRRGRGRDGRRCAAARGRLLGLALAALAVVGTVAAQIVLLHREHYLLWFVPVLIGGLRARALALLAPCARSPRRALGADRSRCCCRADGYATTTWLAPVEGTFPAAGPKPPPARAATASRPRRSPSTARSPPTSAATARARAGRC